MLSKKQKGKIYKQASAKTRCLETTGIRSGQEIPEAIAHKMFPYWSVSTAFMYYTLIQSGSCSLQEAVSLWAVDLHLTIS